MNVKAKGQYMKIITYKNELVSTLFNMNLAQAQNEISALLNSLKDMQWRDDYLDTEWVKEDFCYGCLSIRDALEKLVEVKRLLSGKEKVFEKQEEYMRKKWFDVVKARINTAKLRLGTTRRFLLCVENEVCLARSWISDAEGTLKTKPKFKMVKEKNSIRFIKKTLERCMEYIQREIGVIKEEAQKQEQEVSLFRKQLDKIAEQGGQKA